MGSVPTVVPGANSAVEISLVKDNASFDMAGQACTAVIVTPDSESKLSEQVTVAEAEPGSDWAVSKVVVKFGAADTAGISQFGPALIELRVTASGVDTYFWAGIEVVKGHSS